MVIANDDQYWSFKDFIKVTSRLELYSAGSRKMALNVLLDVHWGHLLELHKKEKETHGY